MQVLLGFSARGSVAHQISCLDTSSGLGKEPVFLHEAKEQRKSSLETNKPKLLHTSIDACRTMC